MDVQRLDIDGLMAFAPRVFTDERGVFFESFNEAKFGEATRFDGRFVQDNHSISHKGVERGLHYQLPPHAQGKLVRVVAGAAFDVAVDIRKGSPTYGKWAGVELKCGEPEAVLDSRGVCARLPGARGGDGVLVQDHRSFARIERTQHRWDDPEIGVEWPLDGRRSFRRKMPTRRDWPTRHRPGVAAEGSEARQPRGVKKCDTAVAD